MVNFHIVDGEEPSYEDIKKDYLNGLKGDNLRAKYHISPKKYTKILKEFEKDGIKTQRRRKGKTYKKPKYYSYNINTHRFIVERQINGKRIYGGCFKRRIDAEQRVKELEANGWVV